MKLYYNDSTKIVFGSADAQTDPVVREIARDAIPNLIANGATVDPSADDAGNAAPVALVPAAPVTGSGTADALSPNVHGFGPDTDGGLNSLYAGDFAVDHEGVLSRLLDELEGIVHMGKSEIIAVVDRARTAIKV